MPIYGSFVQYSHSAGAVNSSRRKLHQDTIAIQQHVKTSGDKKAQDLFTNIQDYANHMESLQKKVKSLSDFYKGHKIIKFFTHTLLGRFSVLKQAQREMDLFKAASPKLNKKVEKEIANRKVVVKTPKQSTPPSIHTPTGTPTPATPKGSQQTNHSPAHTEEQEEPHSDDTSASTHAKTPDPKTPSNKSTGTSSSTTAQNSSNSAPQETDFMDLVAGAFKNLFKTSKQPAPQPAPAVQDDTTTPAPQPAPQPALTTTTTVTTKAASDKAPVVKVNANDNKAASGGVVKAPSTMDVAASKLKNLWHTLTKKPNPAPQPIVTTQPAVTVDVEPAKDDATADDAAKNSGSSHDSAADTDTASDDAATLSTTTTTIPVMKKATLAEQLAGQSIPNNIFSLKKKVAQPAAPQPAVDADKEEEKADSQKKASAKATIAPSKNPKRSSDPGKKTLSSKAQLKTASLKMDKRLSFSFAASTELPIAAVSAKVSASSEKEEEITATVFVDKVVGMFAAEDQEAVRALAEEIAKEFPDSAVTREEIKGRLDLFASTGDLSLSPKAEENKVFIKSFKDGKENPLSCVKSNIIVKPFLMKKEVRALILFLTDTKMQKALAKAYLTADEEKQSTFAAKAAEIKVSIKAGTLAVVKDEAAKAKAQAKPEAEKPQTAQGKFKAWVQKAKAWQAPAQAKKANDVEYKTEQEIADELKAILN